MVKIELIANCDYWRKWVTTILEKSISNVESYSISVHNSQRKTMSNKPQYVD
jgi:hypothetical protein